MTRDRASRMRVAVGVVRIFESGLALALVVVVGQALAPLVAMAWSAVGSSEPADAWARRLVGERAALPERTGVPVVRDLFAPDPTEPAQPVPEPVPVPAAEAISDTRLRIALLGTTFDPAGSDARALIREPSGEVRNVGVDWIIADGEAVVERIEQRRIVISVDGRLEAVAFEPSEVTGRGQAEASAGERARSRRREPPRVAAERAREAVPRAAPVDALATFVNGVQSMVGFETVRSESGEPSQVRISEVAEGSLAEQLGFAAGDRIRRINGTEVRGDGLSPQLIRSLQGGGDPVVSIERASGETLEITIPRAAVLGMR